MKKDDLIIDFDEPILVTGSNGFIGTRVVERLLGYGFHNLRCFVRPSSNLEKLNRIIASFRKSGVEIEKGNLLSSGDCKRATKGIKVIYHLAAGTEKSFPGCFLNSVVAARNLIESLLPEKRIKRFLNVSSFAVYSGRNMRRGALLNENSKIEKNSHLRNEAYTYGKIKQDELLLDYHRRYNIPYVIVRPGVVYGPGKGNVFGRVGIDTFGIFLHLGGENIFPITYVDNCADAIVLAGLKKGIDGEIFNIVDDDLPTCREYLKNYKANVKNFNSIYVPHRIFYFLSFLWEEYSNWSDGQLPPVFNRMRCEAHWKGRTYTNRKLKNMLGWKQSVATKDALKIYFDYLKNENQ